MRPLDDTDRRLLRLMQEDATLSVAELAARAGVSPGPCWRRIEKMERDGIILGREIEIDPARSASRCGSSFGSCSTRRRATRSTPFSRRRALPEVIAIETLLGRVDVRMDVVARDLAHYGEIYRDRILSLPHIAEIDALMLVSELKNTARLPV